MYRILTALNSSHSLNRNLCKHCTADHHALFIRLYAGQLKPHTTLRLSSKNSMAKDEVQHQKVWQHYSTINTQGSSCEVQLCDN